MTIKAMTQGLCLLCLLTGLSQAAYAEDGSLRLGTGFDYSSGNYGGTDSTDTLYIPVTASYEEGRLLFKLTVPYISVTGPGDVVKGVGRLKNKTPAATRREESGLGDVVAGITYNLLAGEGDAPLVDVTGKIKFGTADETKGLGTGETDYTLQGDIAKTYDRTTWFGTLGYRIMGDTAVTNFDNVFFAGVGASYKMDQATSAGLSWDVRQASSEGGSAQSEVTAFVGRKLGTDAKLQGYAVKGFADGSPDWGVGAMISSGF